LSQEISEGMAHLYSRLEKLAHGVQRLATLELGCHIGF